MKGAAHLDSVKSVIVTGAASGIGYAAAKALLASGIQVFGLSRNFQRLEEMASQAPSGTFVPVKFDLTDSESFGPVVREIAANSELYALVNNAGYVEPGAVEDLRMEGIRRQFETNFFGLAGLTKEVLPHLMGRHEGRIVNISSLAGLISLPLIGAYCASKHAVEAISDAMRIELWSSGVKVITINPGVIQTNIHSVTAENALRLEGSRFMAAYRRYLVGEPAGVPAAAVAAAVLDAIFSQRPKQRYVVGSMKEKAALRLRPLIPDAVFYPLISRRILS